MWPTLTPCAVWLSSPANFAPGALTVMTGEAHSEFIYQESTCKNRNFRHHLRGLLRHPVFLQRKLPLRNPSLGAGGCWGSSRWPWVDVPPGQGKGTGEVGSVFSPCRACHLVAFRCNINASPCILRLTRAAVAVSEDSMCAHVGALHAMEG